jgi:glutaminyl-tRNA synthetase
VKDAAGEIIELHCTYDPTTKGGNALDGRKVKATMHWVAAADAITGEVLLYDHLFKQPNPGAGGDLAADLNPQSLTILGDCKFEPALAEAMPEMPVQFERQGYFCLDKRSETGRLVFNRTVGLRDTWAKTQAVGD